MAPGGTTSLFSGHPPALSCHAGEQLKGDHGPGERQQGDKNERVVCIKAKKIPNYLAHS